MAPEWGEGKGGCLNLDAQIQWWTQSCAASVAETVSKRQNPFAWVFLRKALPGWRSQSGVTGTGEKDCGQGAVPGTSDVEK